MVKLTKTAHIKILQEFHFRIDLGEAWTPPGGGGVGGMWPKAFTFIYVHIYIYIYVHINEFYTLIDNYEINLLVTGPLRYQCIPLFMQTQDTIIR